MTCGIKNTPYKHTFDGGNVHSFNPLGDRGEFPEGHECLCGKEKWHNETEWERKMPPFEPTIYEKHFIKYGNTQRQMS